MCILLVVLWEYIMMHGPMNVKNDETKSSFSEFRERA